MTAKSNKRSPGDAEHIGTLLRKLADLVERSSADEIGTLLQGGSELRIDEGGSGGRLGGSKPRQSYFDVTFAEVAEKLHATETREAGRELLGKECPTKAATEKLARFLDLPVYRTDTIDNLREKIVETQIGSRLGTEAVQGRKMS
jgi:hypothetical protein